MRSAFKITIDTFSIPNFSRAIVMKSKIMGRLIIILCMPDWNQRVKSAWIYRVVLQDFFSVLYTQRSQRINSGWARRGAEESEEIVLLHLFMRFYDCFMGFYRSIHLGCTWVLSVNSLWKKFPQLIMNSSVHWKLCYIIMYQEYFHQPPQTQNAISP